MAQDEDIDLTGVFKDPEGFYQPEKQPTFAEHHMSSGQTVRVRLVGSHPLYVWTRQSHTQNDTHYIH